MSCISFKTRLWNSAGLDITILEKTSKKTFQKEKFYFDLLPKPSQVEFKVEEMKMVKIFFIQVNDYIGKSKLAKNKLTPSS